MDGMKLINIIEETFIKARDGNKQAIKILKEEGATMEELVPYHQRLFGFNAAISLFDEVYKEEWIRRANQK